MISRRPASARGHVNHGWLDTYHTFSFADYHDPEHMGFRDLRVINEDVVDPGQGFGTHPHRDMEIITYPLEGALEHKDSMGTGSVIAPGDVQRMSAGTGVTHSEFNNSRTAPVHLLQIWILPNRRGLTPGYEQKNFPSAEKQGKLRLVASGTGREGSVGMNQDVDLYATILAPADTVAHALRPGRHAWVQMTKGAVTVNGVSLKAGDGAAVSAESRLEIHASAPSELLLFDLA